MDKKEVIAKIKVLLGMEKPAEEVIIETKVEETVATKLEEVVKVELTTAKLKDGTDISYDKMDIGGAVLIGDKPIAAGDYELEDGTVFTVDVDGLISAFTPPVAAADEATDKSKTPAEVLGTPEERLKKCEDKLANLEAMMGMELSKMTEVLKKQTTVLTELANQPAAEPVHLAKVEPKEETLFEKRSRAIELLKK